MQVNVREVTDAVLNLLVSIAHGDAQLSPVNYAGDWTYGGPIIQSEGIGLERDDQGMWFAGRVLSQEVAFGSRGQTPLEAAMRYYVTDKLGYQVDIPDHLYEEINHGKP